MPGECFGRMIRMRLEQGGRIILIPKMECFMRTPIIVHLVLLSLGFGLPAWASPRIQPALPVPQTETLPGNESRPRPVMSPAASRGQLLYENHCISCHESLVHIREQQQARTPAQLRARVRYWADYLQLRWSREEVEEVANHLDSQYYRFERR